MAEAEASITCTPYVGMIFPTSEDSYEFYNTYAEKMGFGTRKHTTRKVDGEVAKRYFTCSKEGKKRKVVSELVETTKLEERCGCMGRMIVKKEDGVDGSWVVSHINTDHNHALLRTSSKIRTLRSHNKTHITSAARALVNELHDCNVGPSQSARILNNVSSDIGMHITTQKCSQILRESIQNNVGNQCTSVIQRFMDRQRVDPQFYYAVDIDETGVCKSLFWADERARTSYMKFSDVIIFDVTYKTNSFLLPFSLFTSVHHHRQSTLFGCALLADEKEATFVWLFENWLKCMFGNEPRAIITNQDQFICNAIERVFPNTVHRYCIWHISLHEDEHLRPLRKTFGEPLNLDYNNWKKNSQTIKESENCWILLNERYRAEGVNWDAEKVRSNTKAWRWLNSMYVRRQHWVEAFLSNTFFAGMKSSQRSESINAFFDGFVHFSTPLVEFVYQYNQAVQSQREKEELEDRMCMTRSTNFRGMHELEQHAYKVYTRKLFEIFSKEFRNVFYCNHKFVSEDGDFVTYDVSCRIDGVVTTSTVRCNKEGPLFFCSCAKFETMDILCKHALYIMKQKYDLISIPNKFLLRRWMLDSRYSTSYSCPHDPLRSKNIGNMLTPMESWKLRSEVNQVIRLVENNRPMYSHVKKVVSDLRQYCEDHQHVDEQSGAAFTTSTSQPSLPSLNSLAIRPSLGHPSQPILKYPTLTMHSSQPSTEASTCDLSSQPHFPPNVIISDPTKCHTKGRPAIATRFKSGIEKGNVDVEKKSRTCSQCGKKGHDVRTCKMKPTKDVLPTEGDSSH